MLVLQDSIQINAPPEKIFSFFVSMSAKRYRAWHPDHHDFKWLGETRLTEGSQFWFKETMAGKTKGMKCFYRKIEPNRYLGFAPTNWFFRLLLPKITFILKPTNGATELTAEVHVRVGPLAARLNKKEFDAVRAHMKEEGENLKRLIERHN